MKILFLFLTSIFLSSLIGSCGNNSESLTPTGSSSDLPEQGLLAYYPFNGNARDASGNHSDGLVIEASLTNDRFGMDNSAYHFNKGNYIRIPELFPDSIEAFTFAVWIMRDTIDNSRHMVIYKGAQQGEASIIFTPGVLGFGVNLYVPGSSRSSQNWYAANVTDTLKAHTNYFLVARYIKGHSITLSIDGKQVSSSLVPNLNLASDSLSTYSAIGNHTEQSHSITDGWSGIIDDMRVYDRSLSDDEIQILLHEGGWNGNQ